MPPLQATLQIFDARVENKKLKLGYDRSSEGGEITTFVKAQGVLRPPLKCGIWLSVGRLVGRCTLLTQYRRKYPAAAPR